MNRILLTLALAFPLTVAAMGIPKPKPSAPPFAGPLWLAPNVATADLRSLFTEPQLWPAARARVSALQLYGQMFWEAEQCPTCGPNTFSALVASGAFERLREWNIALAIEFGAVKPGDCEAEGNEQSMRALLQRVAGVGSRVRYLSLDEPFTAGYHMCGGLKAEAIADSTARFMRRTSENARALGHEGFEIGLIEAYPSFSADELNWFLQLLYERGTKPSHVHVDFDFWAARNKGIGQAQIAADLKKIQAKARELGIPMGVLYWGHDGDNASAFAGDLLELVSLVNKTLGAPDRAVVQSWSQTKSGQNLNPPVLTETNPVSLTGLLLKTANGF
ncbi:MAG TPA: hypothetical protein VFV50_08160 [Bdellovibrionales bacterium]|nr:hypothetical protein [Bdellovibrionales bacterium]